MLRDAIAAHYIEAFEKVPGEKHEERLEIFKSCLALHDPSDFVPGRVIEELAPMAEWIADRFERLGDEAVVLAALRYRMLAHPNDMSIEERYTSLAQWSESVRDTIEDGITLKATSTPD